MINGEPMPRRRGPTGEDVLTAIIYLLLLIVILKLLRIIPDPPEIDYSIISAILTSATALLGLYQRWLSSKFKEIKENLENLNSSISQLTQAVTKQNEQIKCIEKTLNYEKRIAKIEQKLGIH